MAVTSQEAEIIERRLRPVYDAIDNGQNKKAVQQADKILKKSPNLQCAKALKALSLLRMGRGEEGARLVDTVISAHPGDSATLQALFMYCRETDDYNKMVTVYEGAAKTYPKNEDILTHLYMSYVRVDEYQKQQKTAVQLMKQFPNNAPYYCWRVMSIMMQAQCGSCTDEARGMFLSLAEKLMEKYLEDKKAEAEAAEIRLYLLVLEEQGRHKRILEVVTGELGGRIRYPEELLSHELSSLLAMKEWVATIDRLHPLIEKMPDSWNYLKPYVHAQVNRAIALKRDSTEETPGNEHSENSSSSTTVSNDDHVLPWLQPLQEAQSFLTDIADLPAASMCRGPHIARLLLMAQLLEHNIPLPPGDTFSPLDVLLEDYFKRFSSKNCFYDDVKDYLGLLDQPQTQELLKRLEEWVAGYPVSYDDTQDEGVVKTNVSNLYRHISLAKVRHHCGVYDDITTDQRLALVADYRKIFQDSIVLSQSQPAKVNQHGDYYAIQAAHLLLDVYRETGDPAHLWKGVVLVETAQRQSETNPQILLLLLKMYGYLGAIEFCTRLYNSLAIKHIQIDSLGYLTNRYIQAMGSFGFASQMFHIALRFYTTCNKETMDHVTSAYKNGVFNKIIEMIQLRNRLQQSLVFYSLGVESFQQEFLDKAVNMKQVRTILSHDTTLPFSFDDAEGMCDSFTDNRDLKVFDVWTRRHLVTEDEAKLSFTLESLWVKMKISIIQSLKQLVTMTTVADSRETVAAKFKQVKDLIQESQRHEGVAYLKKKKCLLLPVQAPPPCQLFLFLTAGHAHFLLASMDIVVGVLQNSCVSTESCRSVQQVLKDITAAIKGIPSDVQEQLIHPPPDNLWTPDDNPYHFLLTTKLDIEPYVLLILVSSWIIVMLGACHEYLMGQVTSVNRGGGGGKKKNNKSADTATHEPAIPMTEDTVQLNEVMADIKATLLSVSIKFQPLPGDEKSVVEKLTNLIDSNPSAATHKDDHVKAEICGGVLESYNTSFRDCQDIVRTLTKLIDSIIPAGRMKENVDKTNSAK